MKLTNIEKAMAVVMLIVVVVLVTLSIMNNTLRDMARNEAMQTAMVNQERVAGIAVAPETPKAKIKIGAAFTVVSPGIRPPFGNEWTYVREYNDTKFIVTEWKDKDNKTYLVLGQEQALMLIREE